MTLTLLAPGFLWALLVLPLLWFVPRRVRDSRHGVIRSLVILALVIALARPVLLRDGDATRHVIIVDRSASVAASVESRARSVLDKILATLPKRARKSVIDLRDRTRDMAEKPAGVESWVVLDGEGSSSLSTALALAGAWIPRGAPGSVTLVSDGLATDTSWGSAFSDLLARDIPVHGVRLDVDATDPRPVAVVFDDTIREGHTAKVRVRLVGSSDDMTVTLERQGETLGQASGLAMDGSLDFVMRFEPPPAGFHEIDIKLEASGDARPGTNVLTRRIAVQDPLRLLYLGSRMQGGRDKLAGLLGAGYEILEPGAEDGPEILDSVDVVMLDDRPASELSEAWQGAIASAVRERGVGLLASGGRAAFGSGGYHRTEIEEMLPIEFVQKEEKKDPSTTLAIIIDSSGSMVGNRMTLAKQVARLAMRRLQPHDKVGIVEFYGTKSWAAPIQSAANQIDLQRALNRLDAGGGTVLMPAIEEAYYAMKNVETRYKHVLVLTDAGVESGDYESLCRRMADEGMTVSTVLVGPGRHGDFLVNLADWGGGRYYNATDRFNLPELLLKKPSTSVLPAYRPERVEVEAAGGPGWWGDVDPKQLPPLDGFVECELRPGSEQLISATKTDTPILASKLHGLGRVTAFMTEPLGAGTKSWASWTGYGAFLGRVLARTARGHQPPFDYRVTRRSDRIYLEARKVIRRDVRPQCDLVDEDGEKVRTLDLHEVAPDVYRYEGHHPSDSAFDVIATAVPDPASRYLVVSGARADVAPESQVDPANRFPFVAAAEASGGKVFDASATRFELTASRGSAPIRLTLIWPWFALAALALFLLDVFHRRRASLQLRETA